MLKGMKMPRFLFALLTLILLGFHAPAQNGGTQRPTSTPYVGDLSIFEEAGRDQRLQIDRVMDLLHITPGRSVADIGAGSGWFTVRAARRVGPAGTVFAEDINPAAIKYIDDRVKKEVLPNVRTVLGTPDEDKLPPSSVDAVLLLKVYHEIARPIPFMQHLREALRPGARVGIMDSRRRSSKRRWARQAFSASANTTSPRRMGKTTS